MRVSLGLVAQIVKTLYIGGAVSAYLCLTSIFNAALRLPCLKPRPRKHNAVRPVSDRSKLV